MATTEAKVTREAGVKTEELVQAERILSVIRNYPEGASAVNIGNELGVDWRSLITALQFLVEARQIERIDNMYYPGEPVKEEEL